jgi:xylulokinase
MPRLLGIDLGTTSFKAVIYDEHGTALASSRVSPPDEQILVDGFWVTVWRPEKLWETMCELIRRAVGSLPDRVLDAVAIAELGLVGYPVDSSGNALYAGVTWIDPAAEPSRAFSGCGIDNATLFSSTGNHLSPIYPPAWITWMAEHEPSYARGIARWLNVGDYVAYRLCGEMALDYSMASQTTLFDQRSLALRPDLLRAMSLEETLFPAPKQSGTPLGRVHADAAAATGLNEGLPVVLGGADFIIGAYAAGFLDAGDAAILTGTWENVIVCSDQPQLGTALMECGAICDAHVAPGRWSIRIENLSGDVTEWYRRLISGQCDAGSADGDMGWQPLIEEAEAADAGSSGVIFVPHVFGSYGPRHDSLARGAFIGLSGPCSRCELTRAVFEGLSFQTRHALEALIAGTGRQPRRVVAMGGGAKNRFWVQNKADVLGRELEVVTTPDVTPRGAAMIAGIGIGVFRDFRDAADRFALPATKVSPNTELTEFYQKLYKDIYLPLLDELSPFHSRLAVSRPPRAGAGVQVAT